MKLSEYLLRRVLYIRHEQEFWNFPFIAISQLLELQVNYNFEKFKLTQIILWLIKRKPNGESNNFVLAGYSVSGRSA